MLSDLPAPDWSPSIRDYHADRSRWSSSMLSTFRQSPALAWRMYVRRDIADDRSTKSLVLGSLVNMLLLEPERREDLFLVVGCQSRRAKAFRDAAEAEESRDVVTSAELGEAQEIARSVLEPQTTSARVAHKILIESEGEIEHSHRWSELGVDVKCRWDKLAVVSRRPAVVELKTSVAPDPGGFGRQAWSFRYDAQADLYLRGAEDLLGERPEHYVVAIRNAPPHEVGVYQFSPDFLRFGSWQIEADLQLLAQYLARDPAEPWCAGWESLEDYAGTIPYLEPPPWAAREMES